MNPDTVIQLLKDWGVVIGVVFTSIVTASSLALRMAVSYVKSVQTMNPDYKPGKFMVFAIALLETFAHNSAAAPSIVAGGSAMDAGTTGATGDPGPAGHKGIKGDRGPMGPTGVTGDDGKDGKDGKDGTK